MQTTRSIKDNDIVAVVLSVLYSLLGDDNGVYLSHIKHLDARLFAYHLQLVDSRRTVHVTSRQQGTLAHAEKMLCKLCRMSCLT